MRYALVFFQTGGLKSRELRREEAAEAGIEAGGGEEQRGEGEDGARGGDGGDEEEPAATRDGLNENTFKAAVRRTLDPH